jgi:hypothetical protein
VRSGVHLYVRRGNREAGELRSAIADALRAWVGRRGTHVEVAPHEHADVHAEVGPMGPLPWAPAWIAFSCELGHGSRERAVWVSERLGVEVLVLTSDHVADEVTLAMFREGRPIAPPAVPPRPPVEDDEELRPLEDERVAAALGLDVPDEGHMLLAFRSTRRIELVDGPPAVVDLQRVFVDTPVLAPSQIHRLRMTATSAGGESRGVRITASGDALAKRLVVVTRAAWQSERSTEEGDDDGGPFVASDRGDGMVVDLPKARLRTARVDGTLSWTFRDAAKGDRIAYASSIVYFDVLLVAGRAGTGDLVLTVEAHGSRSRATAVVPILVS